MLAPRLAKNIVQEVKRLINEQIIIVDINGMIIASTDPSRLGTFHEGALHGHAGEKRGAKELAKNNIRAFENLGVDYYYKCGRLRSVPH